ncbi:MAG: YcxB family protein, partial [Pirellulales bacterium]
MIRRRARKQYAKIYQHRLPRQQTVVLSKEGFFVRTPDSESCYFWRGVERIDATATHAFFYLLAIQAVIVPARAFASEAHFCAFVDYARGLRKESREPR